MSGWENLPEETPAPLPRRRTRARAPAEAEVAPPDAKELVTDGDLIRAAEWYFPAFWVGMLAVVAFVGIYSAIDKLPNSPW